MIFNGITLLVLIYFFIRNTQLDKSIKIKIILVIAMLAGFIAGSVFYMLNLNDWYYNTLVLSLQILVLIIYLIFYNNDILIPQMKWFLPIIICYIFAFFNSEMLLSFFTIACLWITYLCKRKINKYMFMILFFLSIAVVIINSHSNILAIFTVIILLMFDQFWLLTDNQRIKSINSMHEKYLVYQYEEIKNVYLNMRGWRHDYHNHIQVMKAYLAMDNREELEKYIFKLENELNSIDKLVKSGNIMMDAILNSKVSIMLLHNIKVDI